MPNRAERRAAGIAKPPSVCLSYVHGGDVSNLFTASLTRCERYEAARTQSLFGIRERRARAGGIPDARNLLMDVFRQSTFDWLWFVDADMGFPANALQLLLAAADPVERPIVGGLCFALQAEGYEDETYAEQFGMIPTLYMWKYREDGKILGGECVDNYPRDTICKLDATGGAFLLIHRSVVEKMHAKWGPKWFTLIRQPEPADAHTFGEDTSFFVRAHALDVPVHVHTGVRTSHDKGGIHLTEARWDEQQALKAKQVA